MFSRLPYVASNSKQRLTNSPTDRHGSTPGAVQLALPHICAYPLKVCIAGIPNNRGVGCGIVAVPAIIRKAWDATVNGCKCDKMQRYKKE